MKLKKLCLSILSGTKWHSLFQLLNQQISFFYFFFSCKINCLGLTMKFIDACILIGVRQAFSYTVQHHASEKRKWFCESWRDKVSWLGGDGWRLLTGPATFQKIEPEFPHSEADPQPLRWKKLAACCPAWHSTGCLVCRRALVPCLEMVTFRLSTLRLRFYSCTCVLDCHCLISNFIAHVIFLTQHWGFFSAILEDFCKLKSLLLSNFFQHFYCVMNSG